MNVALRVSQKNELWSLIKRLCEMNGEDSDFLKEYAKEVYENNADNIGSAIECFKNLIEQHNQIYYKIFNVNAI